jgi:hypothetical protein
MEKPRRVGDIYDIFITEDMRFGFLARKPNLISSEFWGMEYFDPREYSNIFP